MTQKKINIIGGGFSGLSLAWYLQKHGENLGIEVHLYEKQNRLGGLIQTHQSDFGLAETAANGMMLSNEAIELFQEIQFEAQKTKPQAKRRFIYRGRPRQWPLNVFESIKLVPCLIRILFKGINSLRPLAGETIAIWANRHFSPSFTQFLVGPALQGIYAGDVKK